MSNRKYVLQDVFDVEMCNIKDSINDIKNNHLKHMSSKLDSIDAKVYDLRIRFENVTVKQGIVIGGIIALINIGIMVVLRRFGL